MTIEGFPGKADELAKGTKYKTSRTFVLTVTLPPQPIDVYIARRSPDDTDSPALVSTNDAAFDAAYRVEGAPSDLIRALLDEPVRRALVDVTDADVALDDGVHLQIQSSKRDAEQKQRLIAIATLLVSRLKAGLHGTLSPEAQAKEMEQLRQLRSAQQASARANLIPLAFVGLLVLAGIVFYARRRRPR